MRRIVQAISVFAVTQLVVIGGLIAWLVATGRLNAERADRIARVLRGEWPEPPVSTTQPVEQKSVPETAGSHFARDRDQEELYSLLVQRQIRELEDRLRLNQMIQLDVTRKLEEIDRSRQALQNTHTGKTQQPAPGGFSKELEVFSTIEATRARKLLMGRKEPDAVRLLMEMDPGRVRKIIDTCKTNEEMDWARRILAQLHSSHNDRAGAEATGSGTVEPTGG